MKLLPSNFTFIDLFAGIGGFHLAMDQYSKGKARCVLASEIDSKASKIYEANFHLKPEGDIRAVEAPKKPFDVICGGFPCQTFSKAGKQAGFADSRGTLFHEIVRIIKSYDFKDRPKILVLENVRNLASHDKGHTWKVIRDSLRQCGYTINDMPFILSPNDFGVPQLRERSIILGVRNDIFSGNIAINFPKAQKNTLSINSILEKEPSNYIPLTETQIKLLDIWDDFVHSVDRKIIGFPVWSDYFDNYMQADASFPDWKLSFVNSNKRLYKENQTELKKWIKRSKIRSFNATSRKFEWQMGGKYESVYDGIIQFRTSGIRVKQPTESPALVAMVHLPYIGQERRAISVREAARLQSFTENFRFDEPVHDAYKQLGNAVNVKVIESSFAALINFLEKECKA